MPSGILQSRQNVSKHWSLIEVVFAVKDELLNVAFQVLDGRNKRVSRKDSSDVESGVIEEAIRAEDLR